MTAAASSLVQLTRSWSSGPLTTRGIMISTRGSPPACLRSTAACMRARTCILYSPGLMIPSRQPRVPSIGLTSCQERAAARSTSSSAESSPLA